MILRELELNIRISRLLFDILKTFSNLLSDEDKLKILDVILKLTGLDLRKDDGRNG